MNMIEVKTSNLIGPALDWATAVADGCEPFDGWIRFNNGEVSIGGDLLVPYSPSTSMEISSKLAYRHGLKLRFKHKSKNWVAFRHYVCDQSGSNRVLQVSRIYQVAICRAIVAYKIGNVVSVPAELVES